MEELIIVVVLICCAAYCGAQEAHDKTTRYVECVRHHPPVQCEEPGK